MVMPTGGEPRGDGAQAGKLVSRLRPSVPVAEGAADLDPVELSARLLSARGYPVVERVAPPPGAGAGAAALAAIDSARRRMAFVVVVGAAGRFGALVALLGDEWVRRLVGARCTFEVHVWTRTARGHVCERLTVGPDDFAREGGRGDG